MNTNPVTDVLKANHRPLHVTDQSRFEQGESDQQLRQTQQKKYRAFRDIIAADGSTIRKGDHFDAIMVGGHANAEILAQRGLVSILDDEQVRKVVEAMTAEYIVGRKAIVWRPPDGVGDVGTAAKAEFLASPPVAAHSYLDPGTGRLVHVEEKPGNDGTEAFQNLIDKGYVIPNPAYQAPAKRKRGKS